MNIPRRRNIRFRGWDYRNDGWYFVTICVKDHECVFGRVTNGRHELSSIGEIVEKFWNEIPKHFENVELDEFIVMPNHIHGIVVINQADKYEDVVCNVPTKKQSQISPKIGSLSTVIRSFKSICTKNICEQFPRINFQWQPRFYDHIIRNQESLEKIQNYIHFNVEKWEDDDEHPKNFV